MEEGRWLVRFNNDLKGNRLNGAILQAASVTVRYGKNWFELEKHQKDLIYKSWLRHETGWWMTLDDLDVVSGNPENFTDFLPPFTEEDKSPDIPFVLGIPVLPTMYMFGAEIAMNQPGLARKNRLEIILRQGQYEYRRIIVMQWYRMWRTRGRMY